MNEKFNKLEEEKQQRIIKAALMEFSEKGFEQASTNQIVKQAGIGKGMLFYYFNSKQELYHFLINYSFDILLKKFLNLIDDKEEDFLEHLKQITQIKLKYFTEYPEVNQFLGRFVLIDREHLPEEVKGKYKQMEELGNRKVFGYKHHYSSVLRNDVDPEKAYRLIEWAIKGFQNEVLVRLQGKNFSELDLPSLWAEFDEYLAIIKTSFYKQEGEEK